MPPLVLLQALRSSQLWRMVGYFRTAIRDRRGLQRAARGLLTRWAQRRENLSLARLSQDWPLLDIPAHAPDLSDRLLVEFGKRFPVLVLHQDPCRLHIGVRDRDTLPLLYWLRRSYPHLWPRPLNRTDDRHFLASTSINLQWQATGNRLSWLLTVEPYKFNVDRWISANKENYILRCCYEQEFSALGVKRAREILGAPLLLQLPEMEPVDVVFTWVDHEDQNWQRQYQTFSADLATDVKNDSASITRFHNNGELRYALRSVRDNLPWVNNIHVFSNCRPPLWLDTDHSQISWIEHSEIIHASCLPTFNSHVIESYLHHLPFLTERFLYLNDDFFIMRRQNQGAFFTPSGYSRPRLEGYGMVAGDIRPSDPNYLNAARLCQKLLREHMGFSATELHCHAPYAVTRSILSEIEDRFAGPIAAFRGHRFRAIGDLNIPSFFYHHYAMATGRAAPTSPSALLVKCNSFTWRSQLAHADQRRYDFLCLNEGGVHTQPKGWHSETRYYLERWFPQAAPWERL